jgi:hypothetical protein
MGMPVGVNLLKDRECGTCTKCCEGYLFGSAHGKQFTLGKPCHFVTKDKGCGIYKDRPENPCKSFQCAWLVNKDIPEWLKPDQVNAMFVFGWKNDIPYLDLVEAGAKLDSQVLTWAILWVLERNLNFAWQTEGGYSYIGSVEFINAWRETSQQSIENSN